MVNHLDIKETKIIKKVKNDIKLENVNSNNEESLFEDIRKKVGKDVELAVYYLKEKVKVEVYKYD